ncbi:MAG: hypothetical protein UW38_C0001G0747 [Candidatus Saccharibacteria bacterium GW2011_GWC2_44_17]|nr:MAG: hypothetical protein UW38_C0001G0747 [Candidatus Saccharibacteria bacterium GW2011_GWC2_44_17]
MLNSWGKHVYNLRIQLGTTWGRLSTDILRGITTHSSACVHTLLILITIPMNPQSLSTRFIRYFHLLRASYPRNPQYLLLTQPKNK